MELIAPPEPQPLAIPRVKVSEIINAGMASGPLSIREAVQKARQLEEGLITTQDWNIALSLISGSYVYAATKDLSRSDTYGQGTVEALRDELAAIGYKVSVSTLYARKKTYERVMEVCMGDLEQLDMWIESVKEMYSRPCYWDDIVKHYCKGIPPEEIYGSADNAAHVLAGRTERAMDDLEQLSDLALRTGNEEATGAAIAAKETGQYLMQQSENAKPDTYRSEEYRAFIRSHPCIACGTEHGIDAHHVYAHQSDLCCIPLCRAHHNEFHSAGSETFAQKYGHLFGQDRINYEALFYNFLHRYLTGSWHTLVLSV